MATLKKISQTLWALGILTLPLTISIVLWQGGTMGQGSFNTYTSFSLYVSELFMLTAYALAQFLPRPPKNKFNKKNHGIKLVIIGLVLLAASFAINQTSALLSGIHVLAAMAAFNLIQEELIPLRKIKQFFVITMAIQGIIAILQFGLQHSVGLHFLGESLIGTDIAGVAKLHFENITLIRAYGTFPHANLLAGFSLVGLFLLDSIPKKYRLPIGGIMALGFILAFSKGAFLALFLALALTKEIKPKFSLPVLFLLLIFIRIKILTLMDQEFFQERIELLQISGSMLLEIPQGVGLGQFTAHIQDFTTLKLQPWQFQPVHNIYTLVANEMGIWSGVLLFLGLGKLTQEIAKNTTKILSLSLLISLMVIGLFDHYLISLPQGLLLVGIILGSLTHPKIAPTKSG